MYKIKIIKKDSTKKENGFLSEPINYRVSIRYYRKTKEITITREFYRVGFRDGEKWDEVFLDYDLQWNDMLGVHNASIMTRCLNKDYHIKIEKKLIKTYYENCFKSIDNIDEELIKKTKSLNSQKRNYKAVIEALDKTFRKEKINKLLNEQKKYSK